MNNTIQSRLKLKPLVVLSGIIAVIVFALLLLAMSNITLEAILKAIMRFTVVVTVLTGFWWWLENYGWYQIPLLGKLIRDWPNLNGRWVGTIDRDGPDSKHEFVLEVFQTLTTLSCTTYTNSGGSSSSVAMITNSEDGQQSFLVYVWLGGTDGKVKKSKSGLFYGTTSLKLSGFDENSRCLNGEYWTNRTPYQTKGTLKLTFKSTKRLKRFTENNEQG